MAKPILELVVNLQILRDKRAQDMVEYALMAGFVAVAVGAAFPPLGSSINVIFSKVNSVLVGAGAS